MIEEFFGKAPVWDCAHQMGLTCLRQFNCTTQTPSSLPCSSALSAPKPFAVEQNWSVYGKAAYVASHPRVLTLKYHEIGTLLRELGTFLNRGQLAITGRPGCTFSGILHILPDPPHSWRNPGCAEGLAPGEKSLWRPYKSPGSAFERKNPAGRDAGAIIKRFIKLHLILSYVFHSLLFYLADTFGSVRVSSAKPNSQGRLSSDTSQIPIKKL